ncbi:MAG: major capsid protein [Microvirus sp.]|nr:MAG: major capsid protein [Microvirus sp.]
MYDMKQKSAQAHSFAMVPRSDVPRSSFKMEKNLKTAFNFSYLVPCLVEEVLPGDTWKANLSIVARTATPIVPVFDNWRIETFFFFVPNRLTWTNWKKFMGEQVNPADSIAVSMPQIVSPASGFAANSIYDYMGLPVVGQITGGATISIGALPLRAYNLIFHNWFRDENLQNGTIPLLTDGPDPSTDYVLYRRNKKQDYFTSSLPWVQKFTAPLLPLGTSAPVKTGSSEWSTTGAGNALQYRRVAGGAFPATDKYFVTGSNGGQSEAATGVVGTNSLYPTNLYADLSAATGGTINALRLSFAIQRLLERDARGGSRYTESVRAHFGVTSPDARQQRPEYIGGGRTPITLNAIPQTSATGLTGGTTPAGSLSSTGTAQGSHGFTYSATEHGYIIGLVNATADLTYQQGLRRHWRRTTRYDFYYPAFAHLGEQPIYNYEIYAVGSATGGITVGDQDMNTFGFQERWAELRYNPNEITGIFRSTTASTLDLWHSAQKFTALPTLNATYIQDDSTTVLQRNFALGASSNNQQILADMFYDMTVARPLPMYSVPGLIDHF